MTKKYLDSCVYYFFNEFETDKTNKTNKTFKIVPYDFFIQNELTNQQKLKKTNYIYHFYLCNNITELRISHLDNSKTPLFSKKDNTILLEFDKKQLTNFKDYLVSLSSPKIYLSTIIDSYTHLLQSIGLLVDNQLCYNYIHFDSIVVDTNNTVLLNNFAFSLDYSRGDFQHCLTQFIIDYDPSYIEWPIEFHLLAYQLTNKLHSLSKHNIETVINDTTNQNTILNTFGETFVSSYREESLKYFSKYVNQPLDYIIRDMLQFASTWDNYSLSILYLRILIALHKTVKVKNKFIILFMKLLVQNIHLNPLKRLSIASTKEQFTLLLNSLEPKDYKEIINILTASSAS